MSWQAQTAVNHHSTQVKNPLFRLLLRLAEMADEMGAVKMAPAQSTIAGWFNVSDRTVRNWIDELISSGELIQTKIGSGPGNPSAYQINLPMPSSKAEGKAEYTVKPDAGTEERLAKVEAKVEEITGILSTFAQTLDEIKVELKQLKTSTFETKGGKGGNERWKRWKRKVEAPSRGEAQTSHIQPIVQPKKGKEKKYIERVPDPVNEMINAISKASGVTCAVGVNDSEFRESAYALIGNNLTPEDLTLFCTWWSVNGHYKGKPAIKSILSKIRGAKDSGWQDLPKELANGHGQNNGTNGHADNTPNAIKAAASYAARRKTFLTGDT